MEIEYLREFVVLAEILNFTEASRKLSISQSVLSKHIKIMENSLGVQLFIRGKKSLELSEFGSMVLPYAHQITGLSRQCAEMIENRLHNISGSLKIGSIPAVSSYGIADIISDFVRENRNISIDISEMSNRLLVDAIYKKECDFAFVRGVDDRYSDVERILFATDRYVLLVPANHKLASRHEVTLPELQKEKFLFTSKNVLSYYYCQQAGFEPSVVYMNNNGKSLIRMAEQGMGILLMNGVLAEEWKTEGVVLVEVTPRITTEIWLYYKKQGMSPVAEKFLQYVKNRLEL